MEKKYVYLMWVYEHECACGVIFDHFPTLDDLLKTTCMGTCRKDNKEYVYLYCTIKIAKVPLEKIFNRKLADFDDYVVFSIYLETMEVDKFKRMLEEARMKCEEGGDHK